jgi:hypothetical protein
LALKRTLAEHIGNAEGRCAKCAWLPVAEGEWAALDFHHKDPATKLFAIGGGHSRRLEVLKAEAEKCIILCARCHRIGTVRGRTVRGVPRKHRAPRVKNPYGNIDRILGELL